MQQQNAWRVAATSFAIEDGQALNLGRAIRDHGVTVFRVPIAAGAAMGRRSVSHKRGGKNIALWYRSRSLADVKTQYLAGN